MGGVNGVNGNGSMQPQKIVIDESTHTKWNKSITLKPGTLSATSEIDISVGKLRSLVGTKNKGHVRFVMGVDADGHEVATVEKVGDTFGFLNVEKRRNVNVDNNHLLRDAVARALGAGAKYMDAGDISEIRRLLGSTAIGVDSAADNELNHENGSTPFLAKVGDLLEPHFKEIRKLINKGNAIATAVEKVLPEGIPDAMKDFAVKMLKKGGNFGVDYLEKRRIDPYDGNNRDKALSRADLARALNVFDAAFGTPAKRATMVDRLLRNIAFTTGLGGVHKVAIDPSQENTASLLDRRLDSFWQVISQRQPPDESTAKALKVLAELKHFCEQPGPDDPALSSEEFIELLKSAENTLTEETSKCVLETLVKGEIDAHYDTLDGVLTATLHENASLLVTHALGSVPGLSQEIKGIPNSGGLKAQMFTQFVLPGMMDKALKDTQTVAMLDPSGNRKIAPELYKLFLAQLNASNVISVAKSFMEKLEASPQFADMLATLPKNVKDMTDSHARQVSDALMEYTKAFMHDNGYPMKSATVEQTERQKKFDAVVDSVKASLAKETGDDLKEMNIASFTKALKNESETLNASYKWSKHEIGITDVTAKSVLEEKGGFLDKLISSTIERVARAAAEKGPDAAGKYARQQLNAACVEAKGKLKAVYEALQVKHGPFVEEAMNAVGKELDFFTRHGIVKNADSLRAEMKKIADGAYVNGMRSVLKGIEPGADADAIDIALKKHDMSVVKKGLDSTVVGKLYELVFTSGTDEKISVTESYAAFTNRLSATGSFKEVVAKAVGNEVSVAMNLIDGSARSETGALPLENTIRMHFSERFQNLWNASMREVPLGSRFNFVENLKKAIPFLDNKEQINLTDGWFKSVADRFTVKAKAEVEAYCKLEKGLVKACDRKIADAVGEALKAGGKKVTDDVKASLVARAGKRFAGAIQRELTRVLKENEWNIGSYKVENLVANVLTGNSVNEVGLELGKTVEAVVAQAEGEVRDAIENEDFRTSFFVNGYTLSTYNFNDLAEDYANLQQKLASKGGTESTQGARDAGDNFTCEFRTRLDALSTLNDDPQLDAAEKKALGDLAVAQTMAAAKNSPLTFLGTGVRGVQAKLLLDAAARCKPLVPQYRATLQTLEKRLDQAAEQLSAKGIVLSPDKKADCVLQIRRHFAGRYVELSSGGTDAIQREMENLAEIFTGMATDFSTQNITYKHVGEYLETVRIEENLRTAYDAEFAPDKIGAALDAAFKGAHDITSESVSRQAAQKLADAKRAQHLADFRKLADEVRRAVSADTSGIPTESKLKRALDAKIAGFGDDYGKLSNHVAESVKRLDFTIEGLMKIAADAFHLQTGRHLFGESGMENEAFKTVLINRLAEQTQTSVWRDQYDDALARLVLGTDDQGEPLSEEGAEAIAAAHLNNSAKITVLDEMISDYNDYLRHFEAGLNKMMLEHGVSSYLSLGVRDRMQTRVAQGLKDFVGQFADGKAGVSGAPERRLSQILDTTFMAQVLTDLCKEAEEDIAGAQRQWQKTAPGLALQKFDDLAPKLSLPPFDPEKLKILDRLSPREAMFYRNYAEAVKICENAVAANVGMVKLVEGMNWVEVIKQASATMGELLTNSLDAVIGTTVKGDMEFRGAQQTIFNTLFVGAKEKIEKMRVFSQGEKTYLLRIISEAKANERTRINEITDMLFAQWIDRLEDGTRSPREKPNPFDGFKTPTSKDEADKLVGRFANVLLAVCTEDLKAMKGVK